MKNHPNRNKIRNWPSFLKEFRKKHSMTQAQLANKLQISLRNVENWESGVYTPPAYLKKALDKIGEGLERDRQ